MGKLRGAGARVRVGMLRGGAIPLHENIRVSMFQSFLVSWVLDFLVSWFLRFFVVQNFEVSKTDKSHSMFLIDIDPILPN